MPTKQIDSESGQIKVSPNLWVSKSTYAQDLINQFGIVTLGIIKAGANWSRVELGPVEVDGAFFVFTFYFRHDLLRSIHFVITDSLCSQQTWEDWDQEVEIQKKDKLNDWLTGQLGNRREFSWGSVQALYDAKAAASSIVLHYIGESK